MSNLTNLLALSASGLSFLGFSGLMAGPWVAAILIEYVVFRFFFATDLSVHGVPREAGETQPMPRFTLVVLGLTLLGFAASSPLGVEPLWAASAGVAAIAVKRLVLRQSGPRRLGVDLVRSANL